MQREGYNQRYTLSVGLEFPADMEIMSEPTQSRRSILMGLGLLLALAGCKHRGATRLPDEEGGSGGNGGY